MPSSLHELLIELFRLRPALAADLLTRVLGLAVPAHGEARLEPENLSQARPTEFRADAVVVLRAVDARAGPVLGIVVEVQRQPAARKRRSWVAYLGSLHARLDCPVALLVICVDEATARWCTQPIDYGLGCRVVPLVIAPSRIPVVTDDAAAAATPELAVLSAMAHGGDPARHDVLDAFGGVLAGADDEHFTLYSDLVLAVLPSAARTYLEALMASRLREYQTETVRRYVFQGRDEGRVEAKANDILAVLDARGLPVSGAARDRILASRDLTELDGWVRRAAVVSSADELFA